MAEGHAAGLFGGNLGMKKPEGIVFDNSGNLWGRERLLGSIKKLDSSGNSLLTLNTGRRADWIQLSSDEKRIYYTEDVHNGIKTLNVETGAHESPLSSRYGFASFQILPDGGVITAHKGKVKRLDSLGRLVASYDVAGVDKWFAVDLDTDSKSFWAGSYLNDTLYKFDIATGTVLQTIDTGLGGEHLYGVAVYTGGGPSHQSRGEYAGAKTRHHEPHRPHGGCHALLQTEGFLTGYGTPQGVLFFQLISSAAHISGIYFPVSRNQRRTR